MQDSPQSEANIIRRLQEGDHKALAALYDRYAPSAYALALSICRSSEMASEAVRLTFIELWNRRAGIDDSGDGFPVYLNGRLRAQCRRVRNAANGPESGRRSFASSAQVVFDTFDRRLKGALEALPSLEREALLEVFVRGRSHGEFAQMSGLSLGVAMRRIRMGLESLAERAVGGGDLGEV